MDEEEGIKLNPGKTEILFAGSRLQLQPYTALTNFNLDGLSVATSTMVRSLGFTFDANLALSSQIRQTRKKAISNLLNISRI